MQIIHTHFWIINHLTNIKVNSINERKLNLLPTNYGLGTYIVTKSLFNLI